MAKRKVRLSRSKKVGLFNNQDCPFCGEKVKIARQILPVGSGCVVEHMFNDQMCAYILFPTAIGMNEFLERDDVTDVIRH